MRSELRTTIVVAGAGSPSDKHQQPRQRAQVALPRCVRHVDESARIQRRRSSPITRSATPRIRPTGMMIVTPPNHRRKSSAVNQLASLGGDLVHKEDAGLKSNRWVVGNGVPAAVLHSCRTRLKDVVIESNFRSSDAASRQT